MMIFSNNVIMLIIILLLLFEFFLFSGKMFISSKSSFKEFNDFKGKEFGLL